MPKSAIFNDITGSEKCLFFISTSLILSLKLLLQYLKLAQTYAIERFWIWNFLQVLIVPIIPWDALICERCRFLDSCFAHEYKLDLVQKNFRGQNFAVMAYGSQNYWLCSLCQNPSRPDYMPNSFNINDISRSWKLYIFITTVLISFRKIAIDCIELVEASATQTHAFFLFLGFESPKLPKTATTFEKFW